MPKLLIIEDDSSVVELITKAVAGNFDYEIETAVDGKRGLEMALNGDYSLLILDLALPKINGFDVCRELRNKHCGVPIIMLTSRTEELDRVLGLELGADDYVTKPFSQRELISRIKAILRRVENGGSWKNTSSESTNSSIDKSAIDSEILKYGKLKIDRKLRRVQYAEKLIDLTSIQFDIVLFLASHPGVPFSRDELLNQVLGYNSSGYEGSITTHLSRIRMKLEPDPIEPIFIRTVRGVGYRFALPEEVSE